MLYRAITSLGLFIKKESAVREMSSWKRIEIFPCLKLSLWTKQSSIMLYTQHLWLNDKGSSILRGVTSTWCAISVPFRLLPLRAAPPPNRRRFSGVWGDQAVEKRNKCGNFLVVVQLIHRQMQKYISCTTTAGPLVLFSTAWRWQIWFVGERFGGIWNYECHWLQTIDIENLATLWFLYSTVLLGILSLLQTH